MMYNTVHLFRGICEKEYILLKEYPIETVGGIVGMYVIFLLVFFGGKTVASFGDALDAVVVGYFLLMMATTSFQSVSDAFTKEAQWGTLERLALSPFGLGRITILMLIANIAISFIWGATILALMLATTNVTLSLDLLSVVPILVLTIATTLGLGLFASGASILYKRIGSVFKLFGLVFIGFIAAPVESYPVLKVLPLSQGSYLLRQVMEGSTPLWEFPLNEILILIGVGIAYFGFGYVSLLWFVKRAKQKGVMGHY